MTFPRTSGREAMLQALAVVLGSIPGVKTVDRQHILNEMLAEAQLPAIRIEEVGTQYTWKHRQQPRLVAEVVSTLILDLQLPAPRQRKGPGQEESSAREAFVHAVLGKLASNPTLVCQLVGEPAPASHAQDVTSGLEVAQVRYPKTEGGWARALVQLSVRHEEVLDEQPSGAWQHVLWGLRALDVEGDEDSYEPARTHDVAVS
jgi:hypothetical protein